MTTVRGTASSSGHITLLFSIQDSSIHLLEQGSRGVGLCIDTDEPICNIVVEGVLRDEEAHSVENHTQLPLHQTVIEELAKYCPEITDYYWQIKQYCSLPQQQGFGLSAAGALACAMALQIALGVEPNIAHSRSFQIAHLVERRLSGGLGDVAALWVGGVDLRREPGCPFLSDDYGGNGEVESWHHPIQMLVAWRNRKTRHTSSYIDDPEWKVRIRVCGEEAITPLLSGDWNSYRWREILDATITFANQSGLASDAGRAELLDIANEAIVASSANATPLLCMLGESVVIIPNSLDSNLSINEMGKMADYLESVDLQSCIVNLSSDTLR
ncbi:MAG: hypothetical protein QF831_03370 [Candidatus Thalassarchaeaceae archaeon]|jgi:pantoate kinase|nr:hypothetical protein [Candidatus Thalassarchaeaceae archaeon]